MKTITHESRAFGTIARAAGPRTSRSHVRCDSPSLFRFSRISVQAALILFDFPFYPQAASMCRSVSCPGVFTSPEGLLGRLILPNAGRRRRGRLTAFATAHAGGENYACKRHKSRAQAVAVQEKELRQASGKNSRLQGVVEEKGGVYMTTRRCESCGRLFEPGDELVAIVRVAQRETGRCRVQQENIVAMLHLRCWNEIVQLRDYSANSTVRDNILDGMEVI